MLRWIIALSVLCTVSAGLGFGAVGHVAPSLGSLCQAVFALSAVMLISAFDAFETQAALADGDEH